MKSPCIKVCVMDIDGGLCKGCHRTLDEIARWGSMPEAEREQVLAALPGRKAKETEGSDVSKVSVPPLP